MNYDNPSHYYAPPPTSTALQFDPSPPLCVWTLNPSWDATPTGADANTPQPSPPHATWEVPAGANPLPPRRASPTHSPWDATAGANPLPPRHPPPSHSPWDATANSSPPPRRSPPHASWDATAGVNPLPPTPPPPPPPQSLPPPMLSYCAPNLTSPVIAEPILIPFVARSESGPVPAPVEHPRAAEVGKMQRYRPAPGRMSSRRKACEPCRQKKLRCDGARPCCSNCVTKRISRSCVHLGPAPTPDDGDMPRHTSPVGGQEHLVRALEERVRALEARLVEGGSQSPSPPLSPSFNAIDGWNRVG
ncbi:hypothetical protein BDK51DRAFT_41871 [Blyttiomyces helicus]|uniref:Zn(2)-C6 fungal-type domain-containing protein n=1 Tax=Blyttiomyces helicus TaxID=388810 RepID=A0A4P9WDP3_9FUNG|nr:hypothetical protein BDK51DRAFT_41871 [Blyttiomyces helicus]|eukprot:RKO90821.1 hypothetical protein BDK51DRAFT_41871 [Blyttiomyces helicus]